jgi:hypothetical protein
MITNHHHGVLGFDEKFDNADFDISINSKLVSFDLLLFANDPLRNCHYEAKSWF